MPPAVSPLLLALESQGSFVSQPVSQEDPFLPKQPLPAPRRAEQYSGAQERATRRRSPVSRPYCCDYENCEKAYTKHSHLVSHQRKHTGERPYKCMWEDCTWSFFRSSELRRHTRIHTKYRPHKCDQCGRQFMRSDHLRQHQGTHIREEDTLLFVGPHARGQREGALTEAPRLRKGDEEQHWWGSSTNAGRFPRSACSYTAPAPARPRPARSRPRSLGGGVSCAPAGWEKPVAGGVRKKGRYPNTEVVAAPAKQVEAVTATSEMRTPHRRVGACRRASALEDLHEVPECLGLPSPA
eukprot:bmy_08099T0